MDADAIVEKYANAMGKRQIAKFDRPLTSEELANVMLYGCPSVVEPGEDQEVFSILGGDAPKRTLATYREPKQNFYQKKYRPLCIECGRPCSGTSGVARCWECFRGNAMKKFIDRSASLEVFVDLVTNASRTFVDKGGKLKPWESLYVWHGTEPDFAPALIERIAEAEELLGVAAAFWREHPYLFETAEAGDEKPVFHSRIRRTSIRQGRGSKADRDVRGGGEAFLRAFA